MKTCRELATLQQWIVAGLCTPDAQISRTGKNWKRLGDIPELASYFGAAVEVRASRPRPDSDSAPRATMLGVGDVATRPSAAQPGGGAAHGDAAAAAAAGDLDDEIVRTESIRRPKAITVQAATRSRGPPRWRRRRRWPRRPRSARCRGCAPPARARCRPAPGQRGGPSDRPRGQRRRRQGPSGGLVRATTDAQPAFSGSIRARTDSGGFRAGARRRGADVGVDDLDDDLDDGPAGRPRSSRARLAGSRWRRWSSSAAWPRRSTCSSCGRRPRRRRR
ncbi:MAG: hypothetical protein R2939_08635 [Kofleriaceae bacterium]